MQKVVAVLAVKLESAVVVVAVKDVVVIQLTAAQNKRGLALYVPISTYKSEIKCSNINKLEMDGIGLSKSVMYKICCYRISREETYHVATI